VQQQAAMMSQLPSNRQTMVAAAAPTQPVYLIPQHQGATTMPHAPTVAFQPAAPQYGRCVCVLLHRTFKDNSDACRFFPAKYTAHALVLRSKPYS